MASSMTENECPVCKDTIKNPSEPSLCCGKVFCQTCLTQSTRIRRHCPYCRSSLAPTVGNDADNGVRSFRTRVPGYQLPGLVGNDTSFSATRPVGISIQELLNQLRDAHNQVQTLSSALNNGPLNQVSPDDVPPPPTPPVPPPVSTAPRRRPTPRPRLHIYRNAVAPSNTPAPRDIPVTPVQSPSAPNTNPLITPQVPDDEIDWAGEIVLMENASIQHSGPPSVRTFHCPYCQQAGLDDLDLREHCNANHLADTRRVVCPVCVSLPHGDQQYYSRDFIGHLNLRHCYYIQDITNIHQSDDINMQAAILMSLSKSN